MNVRWDVQNTSNVKGNNIYDTVDLFDIIFEQAVFPCGLIAHQFFTARRSLIFLVPINHE